MDYYEFTNLCITDITVILKPNNGINLFNNIDGSSIVVGGNILKVFVQVHCAISDIVVILTLELAIFYNVN